MNFRLRNVDGRFVSLDDFPSAKGFIIIFSCNHCPYVIASEDRIIELDKKYTPLGFQLIAINSNDPVKYPLDSFENMQKMASQKGFKFPYLFDESQDIAKLYSAERTPHVFILIKQEDGSLKVAYKGAIDDSVKDPASVKTQFAQDALDSILSGKQPVVGETPPVGCTIKWK